DFEFHLFSWMEVSSQWKQAIVYPRWAALAYWGYGEARCLFYPPASWTLGSTLGSLLPWKVAPGAYVWLAVLASGLSMLALAPRLLAFGGLSIVLGAALAAFYILPAAYEEKWVNIAQVLAPGVRPQDNFLFTVISDPDHNRFNLLVSIVAAAEMIALAGVAWL